MSNISMTTLATISAAFLSGCASFRVGSIRVGDTAPRRIAKEMSIRGKGIEGQCLPFAVSLHRRFKAAGIPSKVIGYGWKALAGPLGDRKPHTGSHAVVAYQDDGRTYVMDNQSWQPMWVHGGASHAVTQKFSGMDFKVEDARVAVVGNGG